MISLPPACILLFAAVVCMIVPRRLGAASFVAAATLALVYIIQLPEGHLISLSFLEFHLDPLVVDPLSRIFGIIFALIAALTGIYGFATLPRGEQAAAALYGAGALGVTFAGDYLTFYLFWELMAVASVYLIAVRGTKASFAAAIRYFFVHLAGGIALLAGIILIYAETTSMAIETIVPTATSIGSWLILAGIAVNAAVVPVHAWLTDSYPKATLVGAVFLSALTTKTAVYALARVFPGWEILVILGVLMTLYGVIFAFLTDDIRQVLAYHIVSQVGFMVAGIGIGTEMAINGAVAHAFCHILYKALLFMGTGAVIFATGKKRLSELGGLYGVLPAVFILYMVGAVSISGVPFFNGYVSKAMTIAAAFDAHDYLVYILFYVASVGTFLSVGIKLPYFAWFHRPRNYTIRPLPFTMYLGMTMVALLCLGIGLVPGPLYNALPYPVDYDPFTLKHFIHTVGYLTGTGVAFYWLLPKIKMARTYLVDLDWFYRAPAPYAYFVFVELPGRLFDWCEQTGLDAAGALKAFISNPPLFFQSTRTTRIDHPFDPNKQRSPLSWTITAVLFTFVLIGAWMLSGK